MRICLLSTEYEGFPPFGGFGVGTRRVATGLAKAGHEVYVVTMRKRNQKPVELIDGVTIISYDGAYYTGLKRTEQFAAVYRMVDADVYHSQEPSVGTRLAQLGLPDRKHLVTIRDPRSLEDWKAQWPTAKRNRRQEMRYLRAYDREVGEAVRSADAVFCKAEFVRQRVKEMFRLKRLPGYLSDPVEIPADEIEKAVQPTVCFLARWNRVKRPELFLRLAARFPHVKFIAAGACPDEPDREQDLRNRFSALPNVELPGWLGEEEKSGILGRSWIMVNTSTRECLPVSFHEACAHRCAILSHVNPDTYAERFGYWARGGAFEDFVHGLKLLLDNDTWKDLGMSGYRHVRDTSESGEVIRRHIEAYERILEGGEQPPAVLSVPAATGPKG